MKKFHENADMIVMDAPGGGGGAPDQGYEDIIFKPAGEQIITTGFKPAAPKLGGGI